MQQSTELNDIIMSLDELIKACGQDRKWVMALIEENIIAPDLSGEGAQQYSQSQPQLEYFSGYQLAIVRRASRLSRDFEASVPAIGLILELIDEVDQLRQFKRQWEAQQPAAQVVEVKWE